MLQFLGTIKNADVHVDSFFKVDVPVTFSFATYYHNPARIIDSDERPMYKFDHPPSRCIPSLSILTQICSNNLLYCKWPDGIVSVSVSEIRVCSSLFSSLYTQFQWGSMCYILHLPKRTMIDLELRTLICNHLPSK